MLLVVDGKEFLGLLVIREMENEGIKNSKYEKFKNERRKVVIGRCDFYRCR